MDVQIPVAGQMAYVIIPEADVQNLLYNIDSISNSLQIIAQNSASETVMQAPAQDDYHVGGEVAKLTEVIIDLIDEFRVKNA
jgi:hypothetical protein